MEVPRSYHLKHVLLFASRMVEQKAIILNMLQVGRGDRKPNLKILYLKTLDDFVNRKYIIIKCIFVNIFVLPNK